MNSQADQQATTLDAQIDCLEGAYETLLAYAAEGREDDASGAGQTVAEALIAMDGALSVIADLLDTDVAFSAVARNDIDRTRHALALVRSLPRFSSELIDNLNTSLHLRSTLADLFLISEARRIDSQT